MYKKLFGFTLAEVLIVLGIIGVVAELTIPDLISNFQKQVTVVRLQKIYSEISQAITLSEANNGPSESWPWDHTLTQAARLGVTENFVNKYLFPYMKVIKNCGHESTATSECWKEPVSLDGTKDYLKVNGDYVTNTNVTALIAGGYSVYIWTGNGYLGYQDHAKIWVDIDGPYNGKGKIGKDVFLINFFLYDTTIPKGVYLKTPDLSDSQIKNDTAYGCGKTATGKFAGIYCSALIQADGWKITDDYPW